MPHYPVIDRPCPLPMDERIRVRGHCGHCQHQVHSLDCLDDAQVERLLTQQTGPICVRYSRPLAALQASALGAMALGAAVLAPAAQAGEQRLVTTVTPVEGLQSPMSAKEEYEKYEMIFVGRIERPMRTRQKDDSGLPELPVRYTDDTDET